MKMVFLLLFAASITINSGGMRSDGQY